MQGTCRHAGVALLGATVAIAASGAHASQRQPVTRGASLPDNPCDLATAAQVTAATHLQIAAVRRVPSIDKVVRAQREHREPGPGVICSYETASPFGAITVVVHSRADRRTSHYWDTRARYFQTFPGSARPIPGLGEDAWLAGGGSLSVLVRADDYFAVSTQMYQPESAEVLANLARAIVSRLK